MLKNIQMIHLEGNAVLQKKKNYLKFGFGVFFRIKNSDNNRVVRAVNNFGTLCVFN